MATAIKSAISKPRKVGGLRGGYGVPKQIPINFLIV